MFEFSPDRLDAVRAYLLDLDADPDSRFEPIHRALAQSYKVAWCQDRAARHIGAIAYLVTGEPRDFAALDARHGMALAERLFVAERELMRGPLLLDQARRVFEVRAARPPTTCAYINLEPEHLTLLGGERLFEMVLRALVEPYEHRDTESPGMLSFAQAVVHDLQHWLRPEVVEAALEASSRAWPFWQKAAERS